MRTLWKNLFDFGTVTADNENPNYPVSNLTYATQRSRTLLALYKSTLQTDTITCEFDELQTIDGFGIGNHNLYQVDITLKDEDGVMIATESFESDGWGSSSTATYRGYRFDLTSYEPIPTGGTMNADCSSMYIVGEYSNAIYQFDLTTAGDISTASLAGSLDISSEVQKASAIWVDTDESVICVLDEYTKAVYRYDLSIAGDITSGSYASDSFDVSAEAQTPSGLAINPDFDTMIIVDAYSKTLYQYSLSTAGTLSTATYSSKSFNVSAYEQTPSDIVFKSDGLQSFLLGEYNKYIYDITLTTAWDISTASLSSGRSVQSQEALPTIIMSTADASKIYISGKSSNTIYQYGVTVSGDITTAYSSTKIVDLSQSYDGVKSVEITVYTAETMASIGGLYIGEITNLDDAEAFQTITTDRTGSGDTTQKGVVYGRTGVMLNGCPWSMLAVSFEQMTEYISMFEYCQNNRPMFIEPNEGTELRQWFGRITDNSVQVMPLEGGAYNVSLTFQEVK